MRAVIGVAVLAVVVAAVVWLALVQDETPPPPRAPTAAPATTAEPSPAPTPPPPVETKPKPSKPDPARQLKSGTPNARPLLAPHTPKPLTLPKADYRPVRPPPIALPTPSVVPPKPRPTVDKDAVRAAVGEAKPLIADCYQQALESAPDLAGTLKVRFTVVRKDGEGRIRDADVLDEGLSQPFLEMCVLDALGKATYPVPDGEGEVVVTYPFRLQPGK